MAFLHDTASLSRFDSVFCPSYLRENVQFHAHQILIGKGSSCLPLLSTHLTMLFECPDSQWLKSKRTYETLPSSVEDSKEVCQEVPSAASTRYGRYLPCSINSSLMILFISSVTTILALLLISVIVFTHPQRDVQPESAYPSVRSAELRSDFLAAGRWNYSNPSPCGLSIHSAQQAHCKWSAMTFAWYPAACYDEELDREFMDLKDWRWYSTDELREEDELPRKAILRGEIPKAFMSMEYHKMHCMYTVRKLYRSMMGKALCDNYILTKSHLEHCEEYVLRDDHPAVKGTVILLLSDIYRFLTWSHRCRQISRLCFALTSLRGEPMESGESKLSQWKYWLYCARVILHIGEDPIHHIDFTGPGKVFGRGSASRLVELGQAAVSHKDCTYGLFPHHECLCSSTA